MQKENHSQSYHQMLDLSKNGHLWINVWVIAGLNVMIYRIMTKKL